VTKLSEQVDAIQRTEAGGAPRSVIEQAILKRKTDTRRRNWVRVITFIVVFGAWQLIGANINPLFLSTPTSILTALWKITLSGQIVTALLISLMVTGIGFAFAVVIGIPLGIFMGRWRFLETMLEPYVNALFVTPRVALIPLILFWFGIGLEAQIFVVFLSSVFPILINAYAGARDISKNWVDTARSFGANPRQEFIEVVLPGSVPFIATGLRLGIGHAVIGMIVAEMFLALSGLGGLLVNFGDRFQTANMFAVIIVIALLGVVLTAAVKKLEDKFAYWKASERAGA
jgi:ABC-type nitrate/sulfonate/bicarbonate transport system permease component